MRADTYTHTQTHMRRLYACLGHILMRNGPYQVDCMAEIKAGMCSCGLALSLQVRHRNLQETLLVRVDLRNDASGVLLVSMSHHPSAFSPYR